MCVRVFVNFVIYDSCIKLQRASVFIFIMSWLVMFGCSKYSCNKLGR